MCAFIALGCGSGAAPASEPAASSGAERSPATGPHAASPGAEPESAASVEARRATRDADFAGARPAGEGEAVLLASPGMLDCSTGADCVVTTFTSCCANAACPEDARVVSAAWLARQESLCGVVECAAPDVIERPACVRDTPAITAACDAGACVARR